MMSRAAVVIAVNHVEFTILGSADSVEKRLDACDGSQWNTKEMGKIVNGLDIMKHTNLVASLRTFIVAGDADVIWRQRSDACCITMSISGGCH